MRRVRLLTLSLPLIVLCSAGCGKKTGDDKTQKSPEQKSKTVAKQGKKSGDPSTGEPTHWIKLFDGETLFGLVPNSAVNWRVEKGVLMADKGEEGLLLTNVPFADYELKCEYRLEKGGNSGIFLRTAFKPKEVTKDCYELNMCDTHEKYTTGSLVGRKVADVKTQNEGNWQTFHVVVKGKRFLVHLDGQQVLDYTDDSPQARMIGYIGLQFRKGKIEFRSVELKPLSAQSLLPKKGLTGWSVVPGATGQVTNDNGEVHVKGRVFLQSDGEWGDFVLQAGVRTNVKDANSGIFFRSMKGTEKEPANGYEMQIQNSHADGDRTKPTDYKTGFGTGAIFRRVKARRVVPDDMKWFTVTLVAYGDQFATWVNGYQVVDFHDGRDPDENPRRGLRLKAGHFILQGHDETTDVSFRNLLLAPLPPLPAPIPPLPK